MSNIPTAGNDNDSAADEPQGALAQVPPLVIGEPFAMAEGCEFLEERPNVHPGCVAIVRCEGVEGSACGQIFKVPLLAAGVKTCPKCQRRYSHVLLIAPEDDDDIIADAMEMVLAANGFPVPAREDDEGDEDEDDGEPEE